MGEARRRLQAAKGLFDEVCSDQTPLLDHDGKIVTTVYRSFDVASHADALAAGIVWISTLEDCRQHPGERGDANEGSSTYSSGTLSMQVADERIPEIRSLRQHGILISGRGVKISNVRAINRIADAFVVCTTARPDPGALSPTFGRHCVRIDDVQSFFAAVTYRLAERIRIRPAILGMVHYGERDYSGADPHPHGVIGFTKPRDRFASEQEARLLWIPEEAAELKSFALSVPEAKRFCTRLT